MILTSCQYDYLVTYFPAIMLTPRCRWPVLRTSESYRTPYSSRTRTNAPSAQADIAAVDALSVLPAPVVTQVDSAPNLLACED